MGLDTSLSKQEQSLLLEIVRDFETSPNIKEFGLVCEKV